MKKFEETHYVLRYAIYLTMSALIVLFFSGAVNPYINSKDTMLKLNTDYTVFLIALFTTIFSVMDMAWHRTGEDDDGNEKKSLGFFSYQIIRFIMGFFIFLLTLVLVEWIYGSVK